MISDENGSISVIVECKPGSIKKNISYPKKQDIACIEIPFKKKHMIEYDIKNYCHYSFF